MGRLVERWYPAVGGLAIGIAYLWIAALRSHVLPGTIPQLLSAVVSVGGIAVGFLTTAKSILISIDDKPIIARIKAVPGLYARIVGYLRSSIRWSLFVALISAAALVVDYSNIEKWTTPYAIGTALWLFVATGAVLSYVRVSRAWYALMDNVDIPAP